MGVVGEDFREKRKALEIIKDEWGLFGVLGRGSFSGKVEGGVR